MRKNKYISYLNSITTSFTKLKGRKIKKIIPSKIIQTVFIFTILDLFSYCVVLSLLPTLIQYYIDNDSGSLILNLKSLCTKIRSEIGASDNPQLNLVFFGGLVASFSALAHFISIPFVNASANIYGRKTTILICLTGTAMGQLLWVMAKNFPVFVLSRIICGLSRLNFSLGSSIISDVTLPKYRKNIIYLYENAKALAYIFGPIFGATMFYILRKNSHDYFLVPAAFSLSLTFLNIVYVSFCLNETLRRKNAFYFYLKHPDKVLSYINPLSLFQFRSIKTLEQKAKERLQSFSLINLSFIILCSGLEFTLPFLALIRFYHSCIQQGILFLFIGSITLPTLILIKKINVYHSKAIAVSSMMTIILACFIIAFAKTAGQFYVGVMFYVIGSSLAYSSLNNIVTKFLIDSKVKLDLVLDSQKALANFLGPLLSCIVFWNVGSHFIFILGGLAVIIPTVLVSALKLAR